MHMIVADPEMFAPAKEKFVGPDHNSGLQFHHQDGVEIALGSGMENLKLGAGFEYYYGPG